MKTFLRWLTKKAYKQEYTNWYNIYTQQQNQIKNLKERLKYTETTNIFNFEERKYVK